MPRSIYPKSRRIYMQVTMCVILAGSVALAQLITQHRRTKFSSHLTVVHDLAPTHMPDGFELKKRTNSGFVAQEPDRPGREGRTLIGRAEKLQAPIPPMDYLRKGELLKESTRITASDSSGPGIEQISIGGVDGVLLGITNPDEPNTQWIACCVRPSGLAITLILDCPPGSEAEADKQTLRDIAASLELGQ